MRAFWIAAETLDITALHVLDTVDRWLGRKPLAERVQKATEKAPEPTAPPKWEK